MTFYTMNLPFLYSLIIITFQFIAMTPEDNDALSIQGVTSTSNKILQFGTALDDHYGSSDEPRSIVVSFLSIIRFLTETFVETNCL